jgi:hypothetical protein
MEVNISNSEESHYFSLVIRTVNNDSYNISGLTSDTPVHDLKSQIQNILAIDVDRQRLIYRGHVLDNESTIGRYNIEEGHCVHVVARPENMPVITPSSQPEEGNESLVNRAATNGRRFTGSPFPMGLLSPLLGLASIGRANNSEIVVNPSLEHVRQSILTVNTLASTLSSHRIVNSGISVSSTRTFGTYDNSNAEEKHDESKYRRVGSTIGEEEKHFYIGQWVDVKDTVNQWLAATVMDIDCDAKKLFVHFNGWPVRWDEWIDWNSNRISPFRSFSAQEISSLSLSPTLSAREASTMITGRDDIRILLPEVHSISQNLSPLLHSLSELSIRSLAASSSAQSISDSARAPHSMPWQEHHAPFQCLETTPPIDQQAETDLRHLAAELSPLLDRFGRLLSDLSPYVRLLANSPLPSDTPVEVPENTATSASPRLHTLINLTLETKHS